MKTIKFPAECGVDVSLNVLSDREIREKYINTDFYKSVCFEIIFFKKAKGELILNQQKIPVTDNSVIFISAFQERRWTLDPDHLEFTTLVFHEEFLNEFFADKLFTYRLQYFYQLAYPLNMMMTTADLNKSWMLLQEIKMELIQVRRDSAHIIRSLLYYLLQTLNRLYSDTHNILTDKPENNHAFKFKKLLEENIREKQRIHDYAQMMRISRISLNKAVKSQFNVTATQMVKQRLLFEIQNMLVHSGKTVGEIAFELNFSEPNHLMRFFKSQTNMTVSQYLDEFHRSN
jgi:AraC family transcriptional regulator, transcriptional activator of pobA